MEAPLVIEDSDNEDHAPKRKEGAFRKQLKSRQELVAALGAIKRWRSNLTGRLPSEMSRLRSDEQSVGQRIVP